MTVIKLEGCVKYKASKGKKVKFIDNESKFSEIVVNHETNRIVEVDN